MPTYVPHGQLLYDLRPAKSNTHPSAAEGAGSRMPLQTWRPFLPPGGCAARSVRTGRTVRARGRASTYLQDAQEGVRWVSYSASTTSVSPLPTSMP